MPAGAAVEGLNRPDSPLPPLCGCGYRESRKPPNNDGHLSEQRIRTRQSCRQPLSARAVSDAGGGSAFSPTTTPEAANKLTS
jgi:hypothetical protein